MTEVTNPSEWKQRVAELTQECEVARANAANGRDWLVENAELRYSLDQVVGAKDAVIRRLRKELDKLQETQCPLPRPLFDHQVVIIQQAEDRVHRRGSIDIV